MLARAYGLTHAHSLLLLKLEGVRGRIEARTNTEGAKHPVQRVLTMCASCLSTDTHAIAEEFNLTRGDFTLNSVPSYLFTNS